MWQHFKCSYAWIMIWVIQAQFPQNASISAYLWNKYSSTHRGQWHYSKVSFDGKQGAEDFGLLFRCPGTWYGVFGPNFPKLPQYPSIWETGIARPTEGNDTWVRSHMMWNKELKTGLLFRCPLHMVWHIFRPSFAKLPQYLGTYETGVIQPT